MMIRPFINKKKNGNKLEPQQKHTTIYEVQKRSLINKYILQNYQG